MIHIRDLEFRYREGEFVLRVPELTVARGEAVAVIGPSGAGRDRAGDPYRVTNVLFSSGTTSTPKAIPWTQLTPIKCAMDGHMHQDIRPGREELIPHCGRDALASRRILGVGDNHIHLPGRLHAARHTR